MISEADFLVVALTIELTKHGLMDKLDLDVSKDLVAWFDANRDALVEWRDLERDFQAIIKGLSPES